MREVFTFLSRTSTGICETLRQYRHVSFYATRIHLPINFVRSIAVHIKIPVSFCFSAPVSRNSRQQQLMCVIFTHSGQFIFSAHNQFWTYSLLLDLLSVCCVSQLSPYISLSFQHSVGLPGCLTVCLPRSICLLASRSSGWSIGLPAGTSVCRFESYAFNVVSIKKTCLYLFLTESSMCLCMYVCMYVCLPVCQWQFILYSQVSAVIPLFLLQIK